MSGFPPDRRTFRVALLNPCFWPEVRRGSERLIRELADHLLDSGHRVRLITGHPHARPSRTVEDGLEVLRVPRLLDGYLQRRRIEHYLTHTPLTYLSLRRGTDDLAHAFYPTDAAAAARWSRATGRPAIFSYMGIPQRNVIASRRMRLRLLAEAVEGAATVVALSEATAAGLRRWLGVAQPRVIYPPTNCHLFTPGALKAEHPTILCAAPWEDVRKRVSLVVKAFALVRRERPRARLLLLRPADQLAAEELSRHPGVELFAPVERPADLAPLYRRAWVSALASYNEAFGIVLVESLACGTPVVAANDGGPREIVERPQIGRLFDGGEPEVVARALLETLELAEDPSTAEACRKSSLRFSSERCGEAHEALYRELIERGAGSRSRVA